MTGLDGAVPLADELFLLAHDGVSGKPRLHPRVTGLGLASALLAELMLHQWLEIEAGVVLPAANPPSGDSLLHRVLAPIRAARPARPIRPWLDTLAGPALYGVPDRMAAAGVLVAQRSRGRARATRWVPTDISIAAWPPARLRLHLLRGEPMVLPDVLLACLALACGLDQQVLWDTPPRAWLHLEHLRATLPDPFRELLAETELAIGNATLTRRG